MTRPFIPRPYALLALALTGFPQPSAAQVLTIRISNASSADPREIAELQRTATDIFGHSRIKVLWTDCTAAAATCAQHSSGMSIGLRVVNDRDSAGCHTLAWTNLGSSIVTVNYRHAEKIARASKIDISPGRILGHVAAHEVGHLLLASGTHGPFGIMKAAYNDQDLLSMAQGHLFFTAEESRLIRGRCLTLSERAN